MRTDCLPFFSLQKSRLQGRGTETDDSLQKRLATAQEALDYGKILFWFAF